MVVDLLDSLTPNHDVTLRAKYHQLGVLLTELIRVATSHVDRCVAARLPVTDRFVRFVEACLAHADAAHAAMPPKKGWKGWGKTRQVRVGPPSPLSPPCPRLPPGR